MDLRNCELGKLAMNEERAIDSETSHVVITSRSL